MIKLQIEQEIALYWLEHFDAIRHNVAVFAAILPKYKIVSFFSVSKNSFFLHT